MKPRTASHPLTQPERSAPLRLVIVGHVDHGKSTLVGRLLHDTGSLPKGKLEAIEASCKKRGLPFEWAFATDALAAERDQNVTIETSHIWLKRPQRDIVIIDAPGHREFLKNMVTGAASADAALLLIDAREGIGEQTRHHGMLLDLLGVRQVAVLINKMDAVDYNQKVFDAVANDIRAYLKTLGMEPLHVIPVSARDGENVIKPSPHMSWYAGPPALAAVDGFASPAGLADLPLRFPVQDVYKSGDQRIIVGRVESGKLNVGDTLLFSPANTLAKVATIEKWGKEAASHAATAGQSIGITLNAPIFVERGQVASHVERAPLLTNLLRARLFWLGKQPLAVGDRFRLKLGTAEAPAELRIIERVIDANTLDPVKAGRIDYGCVSEVVIRTRGQLAVDDGRDNLLLGRFVLAQEGELAGGGVILTEELFDQRAARAASMKSTHLSPVDFGIAREERARKNGHFGGVLWFTGLSGSGKSTIARLAQKRLFELGCQVTVLDGDNIRQGLSRDLGFSAAERSENIRRVAEVAALFAQSGMIVLTAFISPYREDRQRARAIAPDDFHTVYVKASVAACERRDPKGLYQKARAGSIADFTGVTAPYEEPATPDMVLDTEAMGAEACADMLVAYVTSHLIEPAKNLA